MTQRNSRQNEISLDSFYDDLSEQQVFNPQSKTSQYCKELFYSPAGKLAFLSIVTLCFFTYAVMIGHTIGKGYDTSYRADIKNGVKLYSGNSDVALVISADYRDFTNDLRTDNSLSSNADLNAITPAAGE